MRRLPFLLALASCQPKEVPTATDGPVDGVADADTDADSDGDTDADTDTDTPPTSPFGLDARPANPTCIAPAPPLPTGDVVVDQVFSGIQASHPMMMLQAPGDSTQWYFIEKSGYVWRFDDDPAANERTQVLDVSSEVDTGGNEMGLLGMAFHPDFRNNGQVFLYYSTYGSGSGIDHKDHLSRFTSTDGGQTIDPSTEKVLMTIDDPFTNHEGGTVAFGPDGYLYLGIGDGGSGGDPFENGQNTFTWFAKMLRIDVDNGDPYAIPADNPFADGVNGLPEIYAWGLRNPFRWSFDSGSGDLWVADVGQDLWEEVDKLTLGGNYGWNVREGTTCYKASSCATGFQEPLATYYHSKGGEAVIGGTVYRGKAIPSLQGVYLFNDWVEQDIVGLTNDPVTGDVVTKTVVENPPFSVVHYSADADGELYLVDYNNGRFWKLDPGPGTTVPDPFPQTLSQTGCFQEGHPQDPVDAMIPYEVNHPFWSDGADKRRWLAIPDGTQITVNDDGDWDLPIGSVLGKEFTKDGVLLETRLLMRHPDGNWAGYSYQWRYDGTDADLVHGSQSIALPSETWEIPGAECARCHTSVAGSSLGLRTGQLNGLETYPSTGRKANQIATLDHIGMFAATLGDPTALDVYPAVDDESASIEDRARTYLDVNCSQCHQPDGPTQLDMDFRRTTALADMHVCNADPEQGDLGVYGAKRLIPGDPSRSLMSLRIHTRGPDQMPPLATRIVDSVGADLIDQWIAGLPGCP